jgi:K+-transporting ATPase ATPase C chain
MRELRTAVIAAIAFTIVLGIAYPLTMTGIAQVLFPNKADGEQTLIGKPGGPFVPRPSVTEYNPAASFFNNQGPNQQDLADQLKGYVAEYLERERPFTPGLTAAQIPADAVTTSASGVDPHISEANARIQANRVARETGVPLEQVLDAVDDASSRPLFGLAGPKSVNVVELNEALS